MTAGRRCASRPASRPARHSAPRTRPAPTSVAAVVLVVAGALTLLSTVAALAPEPASAHTELLQGSPGPAQTVGGTVDFVDLVFFEPISNADIQVEDPSGRTVDGRMVVVDGQIVRYEMPAITEAGRYIVRYTMISADGDFTESTYFFTYEPGALAPVRLGDADLPSDTARFVAIGASIVFGVSVIALVLILLSRLERRRAVEAERRP